MGGLPVSIVECLGGLKVSGPSSSRLEGLTSSTAVRGRRDTEEDIRRRGLRGGVRKRRRRYRDLKRGDRAGGGLALDGRLGTLPGRSLHGSGIVRRRRDWALVDR